MTEIKGSIVRRIPRDSVSYVSPQAKAERHQVIQPRVSPENLEITADDRFDLDINSSLVAEFTAPPQRTIAWLGDHRLTATLSAASESLAPGGKTGDPADRYAASVIETHLVARRQLTKLTNALLKT